MLIIIVIGGIVFGAFTVTEGAAIAVIYPLILSLYYKTLRKSKQTQVFYGKCNL